MEKNSMLYQVDEDVDEEAEKEKEYYHENHHENDNDDCEGNFEQKPPLVPLRMIEFFSGIGGMRLGVLRALQSLYQHQQQQQHQPQHQHQPLQHQIIQQKDKDLPPLLNVVAAYDISLHANHVYALNFLETPPCTKLVEQLTPNNVDGDNKADLWTLSPPCQPFTNTRNAKQLDSKDLRCRGLLGIMRLLSSVQCPPRYILLENVKGFYTSQMRTLWLQCLADNDYAYTEVLRSPVQLGIPNHRLRYFCLCEKKKKNAPNHSLLRIMTCSPSPTTPRSSSHPPPPTTAHLDATKTLLPIEETSTSHSTELTKTIIRPISDFVDSTLTFNDLQPFLVPDSVWEQTWACDLGIIDVTCNANTNANANANAITYCFTAGYGRIYHTSTGSLLQQRVPRYHHRSPEESGECDGGGGGSDPIEEKNVMMVVRRRFTPRELLHLFGFPQDFYFPTITVVPKPPPDDPMMNQSADVQNNDHNNNTGSNDKNKNAIALPLPQQYKLIGNAVSVTVVTDVAIQLLHSFSFEMKNTGQ